MDYRKRKILIANCLTIRILSKSGRRGSNPRPSAWKANAFSIAVQRYDYFCKLQAKSIIFIAVIAHSSPLLPSLPPARSSACSIVLVVINP